MGGRNSHAADVATETRAFKEVRIVMFGVARRVNGHKTQIPNRNFLAILRHRDVRLGNGLKLSPQCIHLIAINARRAGEQPLRADQMGAPTGWTRICAPCPAIQPAAPA